MPHSGGGLATRSPVILTVEVEDYFHVGRFDTLIPRERWYRFERRVEKNTLRGLELIESCGVRATFFVLGCIADAIPELPAQIVARGHEVASLGYDHRTIRDLPPAEFRTDALRAREALQRATRREVLGHRVPHYLGPGDLWALDVLAEEGFTYDSSLKPIFRRFASEPQRRLMHVHEWKGHRLWELPLSAWHLGISIPVAGAGYFRHLPHSLLRRVVRRWHTRHQAPFVMYFRVWELDPEQPQIQMASRLERLRHYRNLDKMADRLRDYLEEYSIRGVADHLKRTPRDVLPATAAAAPSETYQLVAADSHAGAQPAGPGAAARVPVTVVIPCFNEAASLAYLDNTLKSVEQRLSSDYDLHFCFVDDGSTDRTWELLQARFGARASCTLHRHQRNSGVAAAILTGIRNAGTEIVVSMDCDCTYDPHELARMIPALTAGVDVVTASPYHPLGAVRNVSAWRLTLSRGASFLYRRVLSQPLYTYTSCFRVYRRSAVASVQLCEGGFLGVAEMLGKLLLDGHTVVEHPAVLEVRLLGQSKMKAARAVAGHLRLLLQLLRLRLRRRGSSARPSPTRNAAPNTIL